MTMLPLKSGALQITDTDRKRIILAHSKFIKNELFTTGLICAVAVESVINNLWENYSCAENGVSMLNLKERIKLLTERGHIEAALAQKLQDARECRNKLIHDNQEEKKLLAQKYRVGSCEEALLKLIIEITGINPRADYEELAKIEEHFYPGSWLEIGGSRPNELTPHHFAHLKDAAKTYIAPLGKYLADYCLKELDIKLKFQKISRVDYTSGYVWLSAVKTEANDGEYRARVALPGLTVVLKPTGIHVYIELPGKAINFKKIYYQQILTQRELKSFLELSPGLKQECYHFFHTWWFADIEQIEETTKNKNDGSINKYLFQSKSPSLLKKLRDEWQFDTLIRERLIELTPYDDTSNLKPPDITRNSFLIGRFYSREECLKSYKKELHKHIAEDFRVLYPLLNALYERAEVAV